MPPETAPPPPAASRKALVSVALVTAAVTALIMAPIVYLNGPTDDGLRCERSASAGTCAVLQSYFPGLGRRAVERLNGYRADPAQRSVEVRDDYASLLALKVGLPVLLVLVLAGAAKAFRKPS